MDKYRKYFNQLSKEEGILITLRDQLYGASWENMRLDLKDRLDKKPYVFKIAHNIEEDLVRIDKLEAYEVKNSINLSDYNDEE